MIPNRHSIDALVARNIRLIRNRQNISLKKIAPYIGVSHQQLRKYETGDNRISAGKLWELSIVLNTPITRFFEDIDDS